MPDARLAVLFYAENGEAPVLDWLRTLEDRPRDKIRRQILLLASEGHRLRRPHSAPLRDKIHELRVRDGSVNYRVLYFFHGSTVAVLAHACVKEAAVDPVDIDRAVRRRIAFVANPARHTYAYASEE